MKITIEPSEDQHGKNHPHSKVSVEIPCDDLTVGQMMEEIVKALKAWGYANESIGEYLDEEFALEHGLHPSACPVPHTIRESITAPLIPCPPPFDEDNPPLGDNFPHVRSEDFRRLWK
jgi:hypothetical protein